MDVTVQDLEFDELLSIYRTTQEFIEFLTNEEKKEVEKRSK